MLSNRESARRSRKRKQEHLETLEEQVQREAQEKSDLLQRLDEAEQLAKHLQAENKALRAEVAELRLQDSADQVRTGRTWVSCLRSAFGLPSIGLQAICAPGAELHSSGAVGGHGCVGGLLL